MLSDMRVALITIVVAIAAALFSTTGLAQNFGTETPGQNAEPVLGVNDPSLPADVRRAYRLMDKCLGSRRQNDPSCPKLAQIERAIRFQGWCWGQPGDFASDRNWHLCSGVEKAPISARHRQWISSCIKAARTYFKNPVVIPDPDENAEVFRFKQSSQTSPDYANRVVITFPVYADGAWSGGKNYAAACAIEDDYDGDRSWMVSGYTVVEEKPQS